MSARDEAGEYYAVLGVERTATAEEIKAAFRVRAKALHPDRNQQADTKAEFQRLQKAYSVLRDPQKRARYDAGAARPLARQPEVRPVQRKIRVPVLAGLALVAALVGVGFTLLAPSEPTSVVSDFDHAMDTEVARQAGQLYGAPPVSPTVEVEGRNGAKFILTREAYQRIEPLHDRLREERESLARRTREMNRRRESIALDRQAIDRSNVNAAIDFGLKVDAFNRDGAALKRELDHFTTEVERYFAEVERVGQRAP